MLIILIYVTTVNLYKIIIEFRIITKFALIVIIKTNLHAGNYHGISEDTHWTPFLKAGIEYVRETYPKPWDEVSINQLNVNYTYN